MLTLLSSPVHLSKLVIIIFQSNVLAMQVMAGLERQLAEFAAREQQVMHGVNIL